MSGKSTSVESFDPQTGKTRWSRPLPTGSSLATVDAERVAIVDRAGRGQVLNLATGAVGALGSTPVDCGDDASAVLDLRAFGEQSSKFPSAGSRLWKFCSGGRPAERDSGWAPWAAAQVGDVRIVATAAGLAGFAEP